MMIEGSGSRVGSRSTTLIAIRQQKYETVNIIYTTLHQFLSRIFLGALYVHCARMSDAQWQQKFRLL